MKTPNTPTRLICIGLQRWKAANLHPLLAGDGSDAVFVRDAPAAERLGLLASDRLVVWGATPAPDVVGLAQRLGLRLLHLEDGFVRSVGLGSDFIPPLSLVLDGDGLYFDARQPSGLEKLLASREWSEEELARAEAVRKFIVQHGITKYNLESRAPVAWDSAGARVILVPGQVEDDASIRFGCTGVKTNLGLLRAVRDGNPDAWIVYKPHPDVACGNREGAVHNREALRWADHVEAGHSIASCLDACDEVHTMTSLTGFDALLRGKRVVTHGQPFYAGWGLTEDRLVGGAALARRTRKLTLRQLVAGTLLDYPIYRDPLLRRYTTCEAVLQRLLEERTRREQDGSLQKLGRGYLRRQLRRAAGILRGWRFACASRVD